MHEHHIWPESIYGANERVVLLSAREHYLAHVLLAKGLIKRYGYADERTHKMLAPLARMASATQHNELLLRAMCSHLAQAMSARAIADSTRAKNAEAASRPFALISPSGELVAGNNLWQYCLDNGESYSALSKIQRGVHRSHNGWRAVGDERPLVISNDKPYALIAPDGTLHTGNNIKQLCREESLSYKAMRKLVAGKRASYRGWTRA